MHYILRTLAAQQSDTHGGLMKEAINDREAAAWEALHKIKGKVHSKHRTDKANKKIQ